MVYVQNKEGKPLMPTIRHWKVRRMLRDGLAVVVQKVPFTIRLTYDSTEYVQPVTLGVDAGSAHVGVSATTKDKELFSAEIELRTDIPKLLSTRSQLRRTRRGRLRYRPARFENRRRPKGWLPPSIENKIITHLHVIEDVHKILPIKGINIEVSQFDTQKINNPEISGCEYQQGDQMGFWNYREYVIARDNHTCQHCGASPFYDKKGKKRKKPKEVILNVHHLESRKTGGDSPNNLITLCETCHKKLHKGEIKLRIKRGKSLKDAASMNSMRWELYRRAKQMFPNVQLTYGYVTKHTRIQNNLEKSHIVDARCISGNPKATPLPYYYYRKKVRCHNRQIHKTKILKGGKRKLNQGSFVMKGFRLYDKVEYQGEPYYIFGRRESGFFDIRKLDGTKVNKGSIKYTNLKLIEKRKTILTERRSAIPPTH